MRDRLYAFLFWTVFLVGAPVWLALFVALDVRSAVGRRRYRAMLAGARARVRTARAGALELADGGSVDARAIIRADRWLHMIDGGNMGNDDEEHALRLETADGAYYVMVTGLPVEANETLRSLGFAAGRPRNGGRDIAAATLYVMLVPATLLWLAIVPKLIRRL